MSSNSARIPQYGKYFARSIATKLDKYVLHEVQALHPFGFWVHKLLVWDKLG